MILWITIMMQINLYTLLYIKARLARDVPFLSARYKHEMSSMSVQMVADAAKVLDTKVKETLIPFAKELKLLYQQVSDNEHRVSLPIPVAYCLLSVFLCSITYWGIVIFANYQLIHSAELWKCTWLMIGMSVFLVILLGYCGYRKWLQQFCSLAFFVFLYFS